MRIAIRDRIAAAAAAVVLASAMSSLLTAQAPRWASAFEDLVFVATIPASVLGNVVRSGDEDSLVWWAAGIATWALFAYLEYRLLAAIPSFLASRPVLRKAFLAVICAIGVLGLAWLVHEWPAQPEEEPLWFFIQRPVWLLCAAAILFGTALSSRFIGD